MLYLEPIHARLQATKISYKLKCIFHAIILPGDVINKRSMSLTYVSSSSACATKKIYGKIQNNNHRLSNMAFKLAFQLTASIAASQSEGKFEIHDNYPGFYHGIALRIQTPVIL